MSSRPAPVLVIEHADSCPVALVGDWLTSAGLVLHRVAGHREPVPADLSSFSALVVMGGDMGATDDADHPWLSPTKALLRRAVEQEVPTLGICLGHQLLAVACGGEITTLASGQQLGLQPIRRTAAGRRDLLFADLPEDARAVHWNGDVVTVLPSGAELLSTTPAGVQSFRLGARSWGVQFHPEVGAEQVRPWAANDTAQGRVDADRAEEAVAAVREAEPDLVATLRPLVLRFAALAE